MSISELEMKCRELRQLQNLIEEAQAEAEAIKDAIKAAMGDSEAIQAGEYRSHLEASQNRQNRHHGPEKGPARRGPGVQPGGHRPSVLCGVKERALTQPPFHKRCIRAHNHPGGGRGYCTTASSTKSRRYL